MLLRPRTLLLAAALLLCLAARAGAQTAQWVAVDQAPLRIWRSATAEPLLRLPRGTVVNPLQSHGVWTRVREPGGAEGWLYREHLSSTPLAPAQESLFDAPAGSMILAEAADTARSDRSQAPDRPRPADVLRTVLRLGISPEELEDFLAQGGIGEYSRARPQSLGGPADIAPPSPAAPPGGEDERQLGLNLAARVLERMARADTEGSRLRYVNLVGLAVARHAPGQTPRIHVVLLDLRQPVSVGLPGGLVLLSTGLLAALENEAQLALILAHEAAHAALGHLWAQALASPYFKSGGRVDADGVQSPAFDALLGELLHQALVHGLPREQEFAADAAAVQMGARTGYDPRQLPRALERIEAAGRANARLGTPEVWSALHPPTAERLERLEKLLRSLPAQDGLALATERFRANR